jgi:hypothetical protein
MGWFSDWWGGFTGKVKAFFAGPGGAIIKTAMTNAVRSVGEQGLALLLVAAQNQVAGRKALTSADWDRAAKELQVYAFQQGFAVTESLLDYALGTAVAAGSIPTR